MISKGPACDLALSDARAEIDAMIRDLAYMIEDLSHWSNDHHLKTPAFREAKPHVEGAWRYMQYARQALGD